MKKVSAVAMAPLAPLAPGAGFLFPFRIISSAMVEIFDSECREPLRPQSLHRRLSSNTCMRLRENPSHSENLDSGVRVAVYLFVPSCGTDGVLFEGLMAPNRINYLTHAPPRPRRRRAAATAIRRVSARHLPPPPRPTLTPLLAKQFWFSQSQAEML